MWQRETELRRALLELELLRHRRIAQAERLLAEGQDATACRDSVARLGEAAELLAHYIQNATALR
jgi:hypothetical protein